MKILSSICLPFALLALLQPGAVSGQSSASPFDGYTPGQTLLASPFGTVALSGFESMNPANGMLSVNLPLLTIKGRGSVSVPIVVRLGTDVWDASAEEYRYNCNQYQCLTGYGYVVNANGWNPLGVDFGQSSMIFRSAGDYCSGNSFHATLTRATFTAPDGTETEFVDQNSNGAPEPPNYNRGTVFTADNGSFAKFISSIAVSDTGSCNASTTPASGTLLFRDGTTYTISGGTTTQIRDRNGNLTNLSSGVITDSLGRIYRFSSSGTAGQIQYAGAGGGPRTITVRYDSLGNHLAAGESLETYGQLWPSIPTSSQASNLSQVFDPNNVISEVDLADGEKYTFTYHAYGDIAQITLPTGGVVQYYYNSSMQSVPASPVSMYVLTRSIKERRELLNGTLVSRTDFPSNEIDRYDGGGHLLAKQTYTIANLGTMPGSATNYNAANYNQKTTVNYYDAGGSSILESQTISYVQNNCSTNCSTVQTVTTSSNGGASVKQSTYSYDQYNNLTDQKDYDWGNGSAGGLLRETQIVPFTSTSSYIAANILDLPLVIKVFDGGKHLYTSTQFTYDQYSNPTPLYNCPGLIGHDNQNFAGAGPRGNATTIGQYLLPGDVWANTYNSFDIAGNVVNTTDANGHATTFSYADNYSDGQNRNSYAFVTTMSNALGQSPFQAQYDYNLGLPTVTADLNGHFTTYNYG